MKMMNMKHAKEQLPDLGEMIETPHGTGKVVGLNILRTSTSSGNTKQDRVLEYTLDEIIKEGAVSIQSTD